MREAETMDLTLDVFTFQHTSMNTHNFIIQITEEIEKLLENRDLEERFGGCRLFLVLEVSTFCAC